MTAPTKVLLGGTESTEAARRDEMAEDTTVSLSALTEAELRRIVDDDRYRDLIRELLPRYSDGGDEVENSSGYQESSTSDLSDTDSSSSGSKRGHRSRRRRRGEDRGDSLSSSKSSSSASNKRSQESSSRKTLGGADHSSSNGKS